MKPLPDWVYRDHERFARERRTGSVTVRYRGGMPTRTIVEEEQGPPRLSEKDTVLCLSCAAPALVTDNGRRAVCTRGTCGRVMTDIEVRTGEE